jgi:hypothetical protein
MLLAASVLGLGCNVLSVPFFLFGPEPKVPPEWPLASESKDRKVRVVILTLPEHLETRPELSGVDRELTNKVAKHLLEGFKANEEKVAVVPPSKVDQYKADTPNWRSLDFKDDIGGKHFNADYVIVLEIHSLSLYQAGSGNTLFRGKANIGVTLINVFDPDGAPERKEFVKEFPTENKGEIAVGDMTVTQFREQFVDYIAKNLSWYFTAHPIADRYSCE